MIIGISGKINSGKDLIGRIIQHLTMPGIGDTRCPDWAFHFDKKGEPITNAHLTSSWQIKKFADKLKDIVCLLIGCTREQLEDRTFKETPLGEEWNAYRGQDSSGSDRVIVDKMDARMSYLRNTIGPELTPRLLLQLLGTQCGREIIHPSIWVNVLMADYYPINNCQQHSDGLFYTDEHGENEIVPNFPNWIITDVRFPNEVKAIKDRGGIVIRVNRLFDNMALQNGNVTLEEVITSLNPQHESETALDDYRHFDFYINNSDTIEKLIEKVRSILISKKLIS